MLVPLAPLPSPSPALPVRSPEASKVRKSSARLPEASGSFLEASSGSLGEASGSFRKKGGEGGTTLVSISPPFSRSFPNTSRIFPKAFGKPPTYLAQSRGVKGGGKYWFTDIRNAGPLSSQIVTFGSVNYGHVSKETHTRWLPPFGFPSQTQTGHPPKQKHPCCRWAPFCSSWHRCTALPGAEWISSSSRSDFACSEPGQDILPLLSRVISTFLPNAPKRQKARSRRYSSWPKGEPSLAPLQ